MTRGRTLFFVGSLILVVPLLSVGLYAAGEEDARRDSLFKYMSVFTEVLSLVRDNYVDEPTLAALLEGAMDAAPEALDPLSVYVPPEAVTAYEAVRSVGHRASGLLVLRERGIAWAAAVQPGSPAAQAGFVSGDVVTAIDGTSTRTMPLWQVRSLLAGPAGSKRRLEAMRLGETREVEVTLGSYAVPPPRLEVRDGIGILSFAELDGESATAVRALLAELPGQQLVVDLRGLAFGDPAAAYAVGELFAGGELGALLRRGETIESYKGAATPWSGRLVALIDRGTLGAGEVLAAVLRDGAGAQLVGQPTFGHAGRTALAALSTGGRLEVTESFFCGPKHEPLDESLDPDVEVTEQTRSFAEREKPIEDLILQRGLELLRGEEPPARVEAA